MKTPARYNQDGSLGTTAGAVRICSSPCRPANPSSGESLARRRALLRLCRPQCGESLTHRWRPNLTNLLRLCRRPFRLARTIFTLNTRPANPYGGLTVTYEL